MKSRVEWCKARKAELAAAAEAGEGSFHHKYYCFLDEKWFYIRSRRKKLKILPRGQHEAEGADNVPMERESSRRHATKVMILGVIADPVEEHNFDGKVYFTRVARNKKLQKTTYSDKIFDHLAANTALQRQVIHCSCIIVFFPNCTYTHLALHLSHFLVARICFTERDNRSHD